VRALGHMNQGPEAGRCRAEARAVHGSCVRLLPDGNVLAVASPGGSSQGLAFFEFDGTNLISVPATSNANSDAATWTSLLLLPNGQVLFVDGSNIVEIYASAKTYNPSWAPTISSVPAVLSSGSTYQITGTQFNGLSQGSAYGDESQNATNYPLVRIANNASGHVFYCRTHGHSTMAVATGSAPVSTNFDIPVNIEPGVSTLVVVANGIPSVPVSVTVTNTTPPDTTPPTAAITAPTANQTVTGTVAVTATAADNVAVASVQFKLDGNNLGSPVASAPYQINWNTTTATNAFHSLTAVATDTSNNTGISTAVTVTVSNAGGGPSGTLTDTLVSDFSAGTGTNTYVSQIGDGEVIQLPTVGTEFSGTTLPSGWTVNNWSSGGSASVSGGKITVDGARVGTAGTYTAGRSLDFVATFTTDGAQHVGFGVDFNSSPWAIFSTRGGGSLLARSNSGSGGQDTVISGNWLGAPHHYRIDWNAANVVYWIDGVQVVTHPVSISRAMRPLISDLLVGGQKLVVDWMHMSSYSTPATFTSRVLDAGAVVLWATMSWTVDQPAGTTLAMSVRFGNTVVPDGTWTAFTSVSQSAAALTRSSRYIQYQATMSTSDTGQTVVLRDVTVAY